MKIITTLALLALAPFAALADTQKNVPESGTASVPASQKTSTPAGWTDNFTAAKKQAAKEGKDLLVAFSGSDWCGWCVRLEKEVFSKAGFSEKISETFVPVYIDNPNDSSRLSEVAKTQNPVLTDRYRVEGFPTVLLMDADGDVFAQTGYVAGGPEKYLSMLAKLREDGKNSAEYSTQKALRAVPQGPERVKKLDELLAPLAHNLQILNEEYVNEVLAADPDGSRGFRAKYPYFTTVLPLEQELRAEMIRLSKLTDEAIKAKGSPSNKEKRLQIITSVLRENADGLRKIRDRAEAAQKLFAENSPASQRISAIRRQLGQLFTVYIDAQPASNTPAQ